jgi:uncharacterized protein (TIGR02466 family)
MSKGIAANAKLIPLFPTNIMKFTLWDEYEDWDGLLALLMDSETTENDIVEGNARTCFHEDWTTKSYLLDRLEEVNTLLYACVSTYSRYNNIVSPEMDDSWYTIMNKGSKVQRHRHEGSVLSGTLFVNAPEGSHGLAFTNPTIPHKMGMRSPTPGQDYAHLEEVQSGDLLIYPSWMEHFVPAIECDNRTTINFNTYYPTYKMKQGD